MGFWSRRSELLDGPAELVDLEPALRAAADRFGRDLAKHASRRANGPRIGPMPTRLPPMQLGRPVRRPLMLPHRPRSPMPPTALDHDRAGGERSPFADAAEQNAQRAAAINRGRLLGLRRALERVARRLGRSTR